MRSFTADGSFHLDILVKLKIEIKPPAAKIKAVFGSQNLESCDQGACSPEDESE